jgi:hypothetical protein
MLSTSTVTPTKDNVHLSNNDKFCEGNIIRQRYTADHFVILTTIHSERTGNVLTCQVQNLLTEEVSDIHWTNFYNYVLEE